MKRLLVVILLLSIQLSVQAQTHYFDSLFNANPELKGLFIKDVDQKFGFYASKPDKRTHASNIEFHKSVGEMQNDFVDFLPNAHFVRNINHLSFSIGQNNLPYHQLPNHAFRINLPKASKDYTVVARYYNDTLVKLEVEVLANKIQKIKLIYLDNIFIDKDSLVEKLNRIFKPANVSFEISIEKEYIGKLLDKKKELENPNLSRLRYSSQMIRIRNEFLNQNKSNLDNQILFFLVPRFKDTSIQGYMVKDKALGFVSLNHSHEIAENIAHEYLLGYVNISDRIDSLSPQNFTDRIWSEVNHTPDIFSYIDDYEDVITNNGLIAYYIFEEDANGNIVVKNHSFFSSVLRPMKKNTYSYHLQINNFLYKTIFKILGKHFNIAHCISVALVVVILIWLFVKERKYLRKRIKFHWIFGIPLSIIELLIIIAVSWLLIVLVDQGYYFFEVKNGKIENYHQLSEYDVIDRLTTNVNPKKLEEDNLGSELLIKRGSDYFLQKEKNVLYFQQIIDASNHPLKIKFLSSSDTLRSHLFKEPLVALSHYIIVKTYSENGIWLYDEIYNHLGIQLTDKINLQDPPKRILLFVNGYRPTSLGRTFEENFADIRKNGLEFPNSYNKIYTNDRYNYWHPWGKIDDSIKARINPSEVYYADGHYSVNTSNYRSILNFTSTSQRYPKRCKDPNHHVCYRTKVVDLGVFGTITRNTYGLLPTNSNPDGFHERENGGRIAGRNLFQLLNELPNLSKNDTLYIVAHSMGFAYSVGLVDQLRGNIQLGGYYIIAPEDAGVEKIDPNEWKQIWQYGSRLGVENPDAPCLQDGVAPQTLVRGLPATKRVFIPEQNYYQKGFFDSHFIGYYKWILKIPNDKRGHITQN